MQSRTQLVNNDHYQSIIKDLDNFEHGINQIKAQPGRRLNGEYQQSLLRIKSIIRANSRNSPCPKNTF
jgi:hypothetical protein